MDRNFHLNNVLDEKVFNDAHKWAYICQAHTRDHNEYGVVNLIYQVVEILYVLDILEGKKGS